MSENEVAKIIVDCAFKVHTRLGPGLLESVYLIALQHEALKRGLKAERQVPLPVVYDDVTFDEGFRIDLLVQDIVIVEAKSVEEVHPVHKKQLLTYLLTAVEQETRIAHQFWICTHKRWNFSHCQWTQRIASLRLCAFA